MVWTWPVCGSCLLSRVPVYRKKNENLFKKKTYSTCVHFHGRCFCMHKVQYGCTDSRAAFKRVNNKKKWIERKKKSFVRQCMQFPRYIFKPQLVLYWLYIPCLSLVLTLIACYCRTKHAYFGHSANRLSLRSANPFFLFCAKQPSKSKTTVSQNGNTFSRFVFGFELKLKLLPKKSRCFFCA